MQYQLSLNNMTQLHNNRYAVMSSHCSSHGIQIQTISIVKHGTKYNVYTKIWKQVLYIRGN